MNKSNLINVMIKAISIIMFLTILSLLIFVDTRIKYNYSNTIKESNYIYFGIILLAIIIYLAIRKLFKNKQEKVRKILEKVYEKDKLIIGILFIILFIFQIFILDHIYFRSGWDVKIVYDTVMRYMRNGVFENNYYFEQYPYFSIYPNNLFLANIFIIILKVMAKITKAEPYKILVIVDIILVDLAGIIMIKTLENFTSKKSLKMIGALLFVAFVGLSPWFLIPYSDTYSIIFPISVLYNYTKKEKKWYNYMLVGLLSYIGYLIKPTCIIILIAIAIVEIYKSLFKLKEKTQVKQMAKSVGIVAIGIMIAILVKFGVNNVSEYEVEKEHSFSLWHYLMMGINQETTGGWNGDDVLEDLEIERYDDRVKHNKEVFFQRLRGMSFKDFCKFYTQKILANYNDGTLAWGREGSFFRFDYIRHNEIGEFLSGYYYYNREYFYIFANIMQFLWIFILTFITIGAILRKFEDKHSVTFLALIGITLFVLIFEGRARYLYLYTPLFIILAVMGIESLNQKLEKKCRLALNEGSK